MRNLDWLTRASSEVRRRPGNVIVCLFIVYGIVWGLVEPLMTFIVKEPPGLGMYFGMVILSLLIGFVRAVPPKVINITIKNTDTVVKIVFGDLFGTDGNRVIPVNEFFDSEIGDPVSPRSLHGMFIAQVLGGQSGVFDKLVEQNLQGIPYTTVDKKRGKARRYAIGTTAALPVNETRYFLVASGKTDVTTLKASTDVSQLWIGLRGLWQSVRIHSGGYPVNVPLIGGGLAGIGLPTEQLLRTILMSILAETKISEITKEIRIVLTEDRLEEIDLNALRKEWR